MLTWLVGRIQSGSLIEPLQYLNILTDYPPTTFDSNITRYHYAFFIAPRRTARYRLRVSLILHYSRRHSIRSRSIFSDTHQLSRGYAAPANAFPVTTQTSGRRI
jgi:hypothetical protein